MHRTLVLEGPRALRLSEQSSRPLRPGEVRRGTPHQEVVVLPTAERLERALFISLAAVALPAVPDAEIKLGPTFADAPAACTWLDDRPPDSVKVALSYGLD